MGLNNFSGFKANGTIAPSRFVVMDSAGDQLVLEAGGASVTVTGGAISGTAVPILGVSQVGMKRTPGLAGSDVTIAAAQGDVIQLYGLGDIAPIQLGGTVIRGDLLSCNGSTDGRALAVSQAAGTFLNTECGGRALQSGTANQIVLCQILSRKT